MYGSKSSNFSGACEVPSQKPSVKKKKKILHCLKKIQSVEKKNKRELGWKWMPWSVWEILWAEFYETVRYSKGGACAKHLTHAPTQSNRTNTIFLQFLK